MNAAADERALVNKKNATFAQILANIRLANPDLHIETYSEYCTRMHMPSTAMQ